MNRSSRVSRRFWLKGISAGAAVFATPFLHTLRSTAAPPPAPKRLLVFATPNGTVMQDFFPADGVTFPRILQPLEPFRSQLNVLRGLDWKTAMKDPVPKDHLPDNYNMLTARQPVGSYGTIKPTGISIDQQIAKSLAAPTRFATRELGVRGSSVNGVISAAGDGVPMRANDNPFDAFKQMFSDLVVPDPAALARLRAQQKGVFDVVSGELGDIRCQLGAEERHKFDAHIEAVREIVRGYDVKTVTACSMPVAPGTFDHNNDSNLQKTMKMQLDNVFAAFACDLTRVITVQCGGQETQYPWVGVNFSHHDIAHSNFALTPVQQREWLSAIDTWYASQFAYLLKRLSETLEADGTTMLHNTLCVWSHEQSNASSHQRTDHPYVLAGACGGAIKTGQVMDFKGKHFGGLLTVFANAMGVPLTSFGDPDFSSAAVSGLLV